MPKSYDINGASSVHFDEVPEVENPTKVTIHRRSSSGYENAGFDNSPEQGHNGKANGASIGKVNDPDTDTDTSEKDGESAPDAEVKKPATFAEL
ncbi:hypothetical protein ElyMa_005212300, partial [Elysia marginata]